MAAFLALLSAVLFGAGDFFGGTASRRTHVFVVVAASHLIGLALILAVTPFLAERFSLHDFGYGSAAGAFGALGIGCLYHSLSRGPMAVVAPVAAVSNAALPALWGVALGETLTTLNIFGVLVGLVAIAMVSRGSSEGGGISRASSGLLGEAFLAGIGFAGFFIIMDLTTEASTPWPLVSARLTSGGLALLLLAWTGRFSIPKRGEARPAILTCGVLDMAANLTILLAIHRGLLSLVAVLSSLYPASTVILARVVLHERMTRSQLLGLGLALVAVAGIVGG